MGVPLHLSGHQILSTLSLPPPVLSRHGRWVAGAGEADHVEVVEPRGLPRDHGVTVHERQHQRATARVAVQLALRHGAHLQVQRDLLMAMMQGTSPPSPMWLP